MKTVNDRFKLLSKKIKSHDVKLSILDANLLTVKEIHIMPVKMFNVMPLSRLRGKKQVIFKELVYSFDGELFKTIMQQIEITVKNASEIKDKCVNFKYGILIDGTPEYVDLGDFYIKDIEDDKNKEELVVTGYDKMLNFMKPFKQSELKLTYPCTMGQLVIRMGEACGVESYSTDFFNSDLTVDEDFFTAQQLTYRDVLEKVAQATLTTIFIKDNKLYLCGIEENMQTLDTSYLSNLTIGEKIGPINAIVLGRGSVEDNIESFDLESITLNGRHELRFDENEFLDSKREQVIDNMLNQINAFEYYAFEASNVGLMWLEPCDLLLLKDRENNSYKSIYLKARVKIGLGIEGEMEAVIPEESTTDYKVTTKEQKKALKVERLARKNEGLIQDIIEETTENSQKLTQVEQTVDRISQKVQNIQEVTNTVEGLKIISLGDCVEGDLLELHIYGNNTVFEYLYPSDDLYPSDNLYSFGDSRIIVNDKIYELGVAEVLRQNGDTYDEFVLKDGQAKVIRRIDKNGAIKSVETIEDLGELKISLQEGTNTITIKNYTARLNAKFAIKNDYTNIYATKVEMNSSIEQTAEEINLEVKKKVNENEVISKINQSAEAVGISANKIELSASDVLNLLAGNTINLSGRQIKIESDNLKIDENGNIIIKNSGNTPSFTISDYEGNTIEAYGPNFIMTYDYNGVQITQYLQKGGYFVEGDGNSTTVWYDGITTPVLTQTSLEEVKKNILKCDKNALEIINNSEIYTYNLKSEEDTDKKHIGFVIGEKYRTPKEVIAKSGDGIDTYSMTSILWKAVQELQKEVEKLKGEK